MIHRTSATIGLLAFGLLLATGTAFARPAHKQALGDYFGPYLARKLNDCRTCHLPDAPDAKPDAEERKPHNDFGKRMVAVKVDLRDQGKKTTIADRLDAVADEDSDGDGVPNLLELISGHFPGDAADKPSPAEITEARRTLTAFAKFRSSYPWRPFEMVRRPTVPKVQDAGWVRNPIDAFIRSEQQERGLTPRLEAARHVLLRRVYLDLIGLPPTREELNAFLADESEDAYERVVDRLLASPQYGERWGRHWMDVWRYSDWAGWTGGNQIRDSQPHIWRWRDWIIESLNADKGYDRMVLEMLAADELAPEDTDALRATGYLVRNYKMLSREKWLQDTVNHTAQAFLGVTLSCARCHDHMYDPIAQKEYYQVRAVFEPHQVRIDRIPGQPDTKQDGLVRAFDADLKAATYLFIRGDDRTPDKTPLAPGVPDALGGSFPEIEPVQLPRLAHCPDRRPFVIEESLREAKAALDRADAALTTARQTMLRADRASWATPGLGGLGFRAEMQRVAFELTIVQTARDLALARQQALVSVLAVEILEDAGQSGSTDWKAAAERTVAEQRRVALLTAKSNLLTAQKAHRNTPPPKQNETAARIAQAEKDLAQAEKNAAAPATTAYAKRAAKEYPSISSGRRLAFARWIADRDNPLTARVAMNHIWLRHFGQAILPSVFDFGRNGRPPSHPALLDWLAAEFMERGWSMKAMHQLILTSNTYRMASTPDDRNAAIDQDNKYLWRMPSRRVEAEVVRDCLFHVAGRLDRTMGGPDIDYNLGLKLPRRSVYFRHAQEKQMEFLKLFDSAEVTERYQRKESVLPQQALALANSPVARQHARILARTLAREIRDAQGFTAAAFEQVLSRPATAEELAECAAFLAQRSARYREGNSKPAADKGDGSLPSPDPDLRAREDLVHVLLNHNDFVTVR